MSRQPTARWRPFRGLTNLISWCVILMAVVLSAARVALPGLMADPAPLRAAAERYFGVPVTVGAGTLEWHGWSPVVTLRDVALADPAHPDRMLLAAGEARVELDLRSSLRAFEPVLRRVTLDRFDLAMELGADGLPRLLAGEAGSDDADTGRPTPAADSAALAAWLERLGAVRLSNGRLRLRAADGRFPPQGLDDVTVHLGGGPETRTLSLEGRLRGHSATPVRGQLQWAATGPDGPGEARFHLAVERLQSAALEPWLSLPEGRLDLALWGSVTDLAVRQLAGTGRWIGDDARPLSATWVWQPQGDRWAVHGTLDHAGRSAYWRARDEAFRSDGAGWSVELREVDAAMLVSLVPLAAPSLADGSLALVDLIEQGRLSQARIEYRGGADPWYAIARIEGVHTRTDGALPAVSGLGAELRWAGRAGELRLADGPVIVHLPGLLREPLALARAGGSVIARRSGEGDWTVGSNGLLVADSGLEAMLRGTVRLDGDTRGPWLDLAVDLSRLQVPATYRYLPAAIMEPELVAWLDRALVSGSGRWGDLRLRGRARDFPFDRAPGHFHARLQLQDMILDFDPEWPRLEDFEAELQFSGPGLHVHALGGALGPMPVVAVDARVPDLAHAELAVDAELAGSGEELLATVHVSPVLARDLAPRLEELEFSGDHRLFLGLHIPLQDPQAEVRLEGRLGFEGGGLAWSPWQLRLVAVNGELGFDAEGLTGGAVTARLGAIPIRLDVLEPGESSAGRITRLGFGGRFGIRELADSLAGPAPPMGWAGGAAQWTALLTLGANGSPPQLELLSDLQGIALALPPPLGKTAEDAMPLRVALAPRAGGRLSVAAEAGVSSARLEFRGMPANPSLEAGDIRIDSGVADWPQTPGLAIRGRLARLDLAAIADALTGGAGPLRELDLEVGQLRLGELDLATVSARATRESAGIRLALAGERLSGQGYVPNEPALASPLTFALDHLDLHWPEQEETAPADEDAIDPPELPPLILRAADLRLQGVPLGPLTLEVRPAPGGFVVHDVLVDAGQWRMHGNAQWRGAAGQQRAGITVALQSENLGQTLSALGLQSPLQGGQGAIDAALAWSGPLWDLDFATLEGHADMAVEQGALLEVRPGVGRVLGALNIGSLSRRLRLDFSDVFQDRLSFDSIRGRLRFADGQMTTEDLVVESPAASIRIEGRAGLIARDHDQIVTVTPRVSGSLPIAGVLAGGPAVGAALFLAERVFHGEIDQMARRRYHLGGTWDAPEIEPMVDEDEDGAPAPAPGAPGWDP